MNTPLVSASDLHHWHMGIFCNHWTNSLKLDRHLADHSTRPIIALIAEGLVLFVHLVTNFRLGWVCVYITFFVRSAQGDTLTFDFDCIAPCTPNNLSVAALFDASRRGLTTRSTIEC